MDVTTPLLLSKKWLAFHFGFYCRHSNRVYYDQLYNKVLTVSVLDQAGLKMEEIKRTTVRTFNREQSIALIQILHL